MILQSLNHYYDILEADPNVDIPRYGYSNVNISFALHISQEGNIVNVVPLFQKVQRGKKEFEVPLTLIVPQQVKRSVNILPNFLWDNATYVLGISDKDESDPTFAINRFYAFKKFNIDLLKQADCEEAKAMITFLSIHNPQTIRTNDLFTPFLDQLLKGTNLVFKLENKSGFIHEDPNIRNVWGKHIANSQEEHFSQCLVTGEQLVAARLHPNLKGIKGTNAVGGSLIGFNADAYESYNKKQGLNSPVSERATFAYITVLNYLLSPNNKNRKFTIGDTTVVYWAESPDKTYPTVFEALFDPDWYASPPETLEGETRDTLAEKRMEKIAKKIQLAQALNIDGVMENLDPQTKFYVLGLSPNAARVSVRFFYQDVFRNIIENLMNHYSDMGIERQYEKQPKAISPRRIIEETVSPKARVKKPSPLLSGALFQSILMNNPYPASVYTSIITRIRCDMDDKDENIEKINYFRASILKACLTRKYRHINQPKIKEVLCMSLNEKATQPAYLLGRLFAVLEKAQLEAAKPATLNTTIKDRYFASACATPASVFPVLLRLSQHHISKAEYGKNLDSRIENIMGLLEIEQNPFPAHLPLDEQGVFVLGYYHQRADFYKPRSDKAAE
jgi:CRISPR-associated protein Csd1